MASRYPILELRGRKGDGEEVSRERERSSASTRRVSDW